MPKTKLTYEDCLELLRTVPCEQPVQVGDHSICVGCTASLALSELKKLRKLQQDILDQNEWP